MLIELPIQIANAEEQHLVQTNHIMEAYGFDGDLTRIVLIDGSFRTVNLTYDAFVVYLLQAQAAYQYPTAAV